VPTLDVRQIKELIPHRAPFLLVDRILEIEPDKMVTGELDIRGDEFWCVGHFPGRPIMPGVLIIEALAQTGGILTFTSRPAWRGQVMFFAGIDNARFRRPVVPGDRLRLEVVFTGGRQRLVKMHGQAFVGTELAAEADMSAVVADEKLPA